MPVTEIKEFDLMSVAKICGGICAIFGLILGLILGFYILAGGIKAETLQGYLPWISGDRTTAGLMSILLTPIAYGILGVIFGYLWAAFYNWISKRLGGIRFRA